MESPTPSSFPATRKGYNSYLKDLGIDPKSHNTVLFFAISYTEFKCLDRRSIDEKMDEAGAECERLHSVYIDALKDGRFADADFAEAGWNRRSKEFCALGREKLGL